MERKNIYWLSLNLIFWLIYGFCYYQIISIYNLSYSIPYHHFITLVSQVFLVYFINFFLFKKYYQSGKQSHFYALAILSIIYTFPVIRLAVMIIAGINVTFSRIFTTELLVIYFITLTLVIISLSIKFIIERNKEKEEIIAIENQKREIELFALKNQIDSHFLFNTLNSIYGLSLKKSDLAPKAILLLSEILSYVIYETKKDFYPLSHEMQLINNYIELERIRWGKEISIKFETDGTIENSFVAPLILFTFIENSFKHGVAKTLDNPWVSIKVSVGQDETIFEIENSIPTNAANILKFNSKGIGFENIKHRLSLLYPNMYYLSTRVNENSFYVRLTLTNR
jgi:two-component system, LytTR family, sensor kinase